MIYFDQAATSLQKPETVGKAVYDSLTAGIIGNPSRGGHRASIEASRVIHNTRNSLEMLFHAKNYDVVLSKNVTEALNIVIKGAFDCNDHIITSILEHNSVLRPLYELNTRGVEIDYIPCISNTTILDYDVLSQLVKPTTRAVIVTHASNVTGVVTDLAKISKFCKKHDLLLIVDGAQTAGLIEIDLDAIDVDVFCFTGHKSLYGPQGTGGMFVKKGTPIRTFLSGGSGVFTFSKTQPSIMPEALEAGTPNTHGFAGLLAGVNYVIEIGTKQLHRHVFSLTKYFYNEVSQMSHIKLYSNVSVLNSGVIALNVGDLDSAEVSEYLDDSFNILTRPGAHCAPLVHQHFDTINQGMVRFSFSSFNTLEEVKHAVQALKALEKEV